MSLSRLPKIFAKILLAALGLAIVLIVAALVAVNVSPRPFAWLVRTQFGKGIGVPAVAPAIYPEFLPKVRAERDIEYPSRFGSHRLDIFSPKDFTGSRPVILWVHGGGFVGGDKSGIQTWATMMAAKGYAVVSINYEPAPKSRYPGPVIQLGEAYEFLKSNPQRFPSLDLRRLILGGDSAGAQIASQFAALQTNAELAKSMRLAPLVPREDLIAVLLYCGPYDLRGLYDLRAWLPRFFVRQIGWVYFGIRKWRDTAQAAQASTVENVTPDYPAVFITDGNRGSFEGDARKLEAKLKQNGVEVDSLYYPAERGALPHEYQFDFSIPESMECYERTLAFLKKVAVDR